MNKYFLIITYLFLGFAIQAQDGYHLALLNQIQNEYSINGGTFVLSSNDSTNANAFSIYGNQSNSIENISGQDFTLANDVTVNAQGTNPWDAGMVQSNNTTINQSDKVLLVCWLRILSGVTNDSKVNIFVEDASNFDKEIFATVNLTTQWQQFFLPFEASKSFLAGELNSGFHLAHDAHQIQIGGFTLINYANNYNLNQLPLDIHNDMYGGYEASATWRGPAATRIDQHRKADLTVQVVDHNNNPISNATVDINMQQHEYGFGTAIVNTKVAGNSNQDSIYESKITNLDGAGHGFNIVVTENALKWRAWEQGWAGTKAESVNTIAWAKANDMEIRGHTVLWPGNARIPSDVVDSLSNGNLAFAKTRIFNHVDNLLNYSGVKDSITEWDVINEFTLNEDVANAFANTPGYITGREIYTELITKIKTDHPNVKQYINDYVTIGSGVMNTPNYFQYKNYIQEQSNAGTPFDGVGFQAHIGAEPTSINVVYNILEDFHQSFGMEAKITEYDLSDLVNATTSASYLKDFLTMTFSHPSTDAFLMWGFWDGAHWMGHAPMFNLDWSIKPAGQQFIDLVFDDWWTDESTVTNAQGLTTTRGFKGDYIITVSHNNQTVAANYTLSENGTIVIQINEGIEICDNQIDDDGDGLTDEVEQNIWIGANSNDWHDDANWSIGIIPSLCHEVIINAPSNVVVSPSKIGLGYTLDVKLGAQLQVNGALDIQVQNF